MKNTVKAFLRLASVALASAVLLGLMVSGIGWVAGWRSADRFSNGLSMVGSIIFVLGILSMLGGYRMRSSFRVPNSPPAGGMNLGDRTRALAAEVTRGANTVILLILIGALLVAASILVGRLAG